MLRRFRIDSTTERATRLNACVGVSHRETTSPGGLWMPDGP